MSTELKHPFPEVENWIMELERRARAEKDFREVLEKIASRTIYFAPTGGLFADYAREVLAKHPEQKRHE